MGALDRAVLVSDPAVVAGRRHPVVLERSIVALSQTGAGVRVEVAERG
jgi:hypothetical protein